MAEPLESTTTTTTATFADDFLADFEPGLSPAEEEGEEEEELEWMKSFPPLETFVAPPPTPTPPAEAAAPPAARSPVSVLTLAPPMKLPARARSKIRRRKRRFFYNVPVAAEISVPVPVAREKGNRKCLHCGSETTPQWRAGPMGPKTLCNACGVRYKSGRLVPEYRPANSPTFSAALHSNSHRRIMEMRRRSTGRGRPRLVIL